MQCLAAVEGEYISTEMFVCTLVLCYEYVYCCNH